MGKWFGAQSMAVKTLIAVLGVALVVSGGVLVYLNVKPDDKPARDPGKNVETTVADSSKPTKEPEKGSETPADKPEEQPEKQPEDTKDPAGETTVEEQPEVSEVTYQNTSGKLVNGNFADGTNWYEVYSYNPDSISYSADAKNGFEIEISDTGDEDWHVQLKQAGIQLTKEKWYMLTLDAKSSMSRNIVCTMQRDGTEDNNWTPYSPSQRLALNKSWQTYTVIFQMKENTDKNAIFNLSMGTVDGVRITKKHTVGIRNIKLEQLSDSWLDSLREGDNLVRNGNFAYKDILWESSVVAPGKASVSFDNNKAVFGIVNPGTVDWHVQLKQGGIKLEQGMGYRLTFKASSTAARTIKVGFMDTNYVSWYGGGDVSLGQVAETNVSIEFYMDKATNADAVMMISMGKIENQNTAASVISLSDFKLVKVPGMTPSSSGGGGGNPYFYLPGGWVVYDHENKHVAAASADDENGYKIQLIDNGTEDWHIQLQKQRVTLEKDHWYRVSFETKASMNRTIAYMLQRDGSADDNWVSYAPADGGRLVLTGAWQTVSHTFQMKHETDKAANFNFSLGSVGGKIWEPHAVWIRNIQLVEVEAPKLESVALNTEMIKNGGFAEGDAHWASYVDSNAAAAVSYSGGRAVFGITKVGTEDYHVQLKQGDLYLEKGCKYRVTFKAVSTAARTIKLGMLSPSYDWYGGTDVALAANVPTTVTFDFTMEKDSDPSTTMQISMGQIYINDNKATPLATPASQITLSGFSMMKIAAPGSEEDKPAPSPIAPGEEILKDLNFVEGNTSWENYVDASGAATVAYQDGKAVFNISNVGTADSSVQLKQGGLQLEKGSSYELTFRATASAARTIKVGFLGPDRKWAWYGGDDIKLSATPSPASTIALSIANSIANMTRASRETDTLWKVEFTMNAETDYNAVLAISMGKIEGEDTPPCVVTLSDFSLKKVEKEQNPEPAGDNMIKNGDFANLDASWVAYADASNGADAAITYADNKVTFAITKVGTEEYHIQLKQGDLTMVKDAKYRLTFKAASTAARDIKVGFLDEKAGYLWYGGDSVSIGGTEETKTIEFTVSQKTCTDVTMQVSMGKMADGDTPASTITLSEFKLVKLSGPADPEPGEDNPGEDNPGTEDPADGNLLKGSWESYVHKPGGADATVEYSDGTATVEIKALGTDDWNIQLKQSGLTLEAGASYKLTFQGSSTAARTIKAAILDGGDDWFGGADIELGTDEAEVTATIKVLEGKDSYEGLRLQISMGKVDGAEPSTIRMSNIKLVKVTETGENPGGEDPGEDNPGTEDPADGNLLKGSWESYVHKPGGADATVEYSDGTATVEIKALGTDDWNIQLKQSGLTLEAGASYKLTFKGSSTAARTIKAAILDGGDDWFGGADIELGTDEAEVTATIKVLEGKDSYEGLRLQISMGKVDGAEPSTIRMSNIKLVKVTESGENPGTEDPGEDNPGTEDPADGNLLKGSWESYVHKPGGADATVEYSDGTATVEIKALGTDDWNIQLKQSGLTLEAGASYKLTFKGSSTVARTIKAAIQDSGDDWFGGADIGLGTDEAEVTATIKVLEGKDSYEGLRLQISMGKVDGAEPSTIKMSNIKLVKVTETGENPGEENPGEENPGENPGTEDPSEEDPADGNLLKGSWESYVHKPGGADATVEYSDGIATAEIKALGTDDWNIQLKQGGLTLEAGASYKLTFKGSSTVARTIKAAIQDSGDDWFGGADIGLGTDEAEVTATIKVLEGKDSYEGLRLQISMGKIDGAEPSTIKMSNIKLVKVTETGENPGENPGEENPGEENPGENPGTEDPGEENPGENPGTEDPGEEDPGENPGTEDPSEEDPADGNLLKGSWESYVHKPGGADATVEYSDGTATVEIKALGTDDWNIQLKQSGLTLEAGASYKLTFKGSSTVARTIKAAILDGGDDWFGGADIELGTDEAEVTATIKVLEGKDSYEGLRLQISMGKVDGAEPSTIKMSNIKLVKVTETGENPGENPGTEDPGEENPGENPGTEDPGEEDPGENPGTEDPSEEDPADGNLLKGSWESYVHKPGGADATVEYSDGIATAEIKELGTDDWNIQLKQGGLNLEEGASYKLTLKGSSTAARTIKAAIQDSGDGWFGGADIALGTDEAEVEATIKVLEGKGSYKGLRLQISMGKVDGAVPSTIKMSDFRLVQIN